MLAGFMPPQFSIGARCRIAQWVPPRPRPTPETVVAKKKTLSEHQIHLNAKALADPRRLIVD